MTGEHDPALNMISVGTSPEKLSVEQLAGAYNHIERQLPDDRKREENG